MNTETNTTFTRSPLAMAATIAEVLDELGTGHEVNCWLPDAALRAVDRLEGGEMGEASALLRALSDRFTDCRTQYFLLGQVKELRAELDRIEANETSASAR